MRLVRASTGQVLKLAASATLGAGGEAKVFAVLDAPELAAKVYHRPTAERADKLAAMLALGLFVVRPVLRSTRACARRKPRSQAMAPMPWSSRQRAANWLGLRCTCAARSTSIG